MALRSEYILKRWNIDREKKNYLLRRWWLVRYLARRWRFSRMSQPRKPRGGKSSLQDLWNKPSSAAHKVGF